jgi:hypothetical protein
MKDLSALTLEDFAATVGTAYAADAGPAGTVELRLLSADAAGGPVPGAARAPFSLVFSGPFEAQLPQATFLLAHPELGELPIFLVPIGSDADGVRYEAVFG